MDSQRFLRKKFAPFQVGPRFPELLNENLYVGVYNGHNVSVIEKRAIHNIYNGGNFGKGSISKSAPTQQMTDDLPEILMRQQWENRVKWKASSDKSKTEDNRVYINSIQNLLDSACTKSDESWKSWKEIKNAEIETVSDEGRTDKNVYSASRSNKKISDDPFISMVEEIIHTGKMREEKPSYQEDKKVVLVVENNEDQSTSVEEFNFSNITVKLRTSSIQIKEVLKLNLVEAFFLCFAVGQMKIINESGVEMSVLDLWKEFYRAEDNFISKYVAYHHYRAHGWTVKSGIKYGGDYLLYKIGPAYYHASYLVWLLNKRKKKRMSWSEFVALNRLVETCNKDLLLCEILDSDVNDWTSPNTLNQISVLEVVSKRWIPSQERSQAN